jgi:CHAT domain-containing protein/tetratricopeptide (TPR) repeat protein
MPQEQRSSYPGILHFRSISLPLERLVLLALICFLPGLAVLSETTVKDAELISPGAPVVRELAGGEAQSFDISMKPGQFLDLSIKKDDLNLTLVLYGPAGGVLVQQVSHTYEILHISNVAVSAGVYRLELRSLELDQKTPRRFELYLEPLRQATASDRKDSLAHRQVALATLLRAEWKETSLRKALQKYSEARQIWLFLGELRKAASASLAEGDVYFTLGEYRAALRHYESAAQEANRAGAKPEEFQALSQAGRLHSYLGNNDKAQASLAQALAYYSSVAGEARSSYLKRDHAEALTNLGEVYYSKGNLVKSSEYFNQSLTLFSEVGDRRGQARAHLFAGYIAGSIGQPDTAEDQISQALSLYRAASDKSGEALALTAQGLFHSFKGEDETAIKIHREAMANFQTIGDRQSEAITLNAVGQAYEHLREYPLALDNYEHGLKLFQANGNQDFASVILYKIAGIHRLVGNRKLALSYYDRCIKLSQEIKKTRMVAYALNDVAAIHASEKDRVKTVQQFEKLLKFYNSIGDRVGEALARNNLGDFLLSTGDREKALFNYGEALRLSQQASDKDSEITSLYNLARTKRDAGALEGALSNIRRSIQIIESLRSNVASPDFRSSYFAGVRKHYDLYIDILMKLDRVKPGQGFATDALLASEGSRARTLLEILREARADIRQGVDEKILRRERELEALLRSQAQYQVEISSNEKNQAEVDEVKRQIDLLRAEYQDIQAQIRVHNLRLLYLTQPSPLTLEEIQRQLGGDGNTVLLEYALGDERSYLWAVTKDSVASYELPARATLENAGREVYELTTARQSISDKVDAAYQANVEKADRQYLAKALGLSRMLFGPVAEQLGNKRLLIVTEGVLQYIPFDALPIPPVDNQRTNPATVPVDFEHWSPLIDAHEIITLPSVSTLAAIRLEPRRSGVRNKVLAVLADPVFSADDDRVEVDRSQRTGASFSNSGQESNRLAFRGFVAPIHGGGPARLAHASEEADAIIAAVPHGSSMAAKGFDATRETAMSAEVGQYQILHLATHGVLNNEHPELSGIVLTTVKRDGTEAAGFLPLHDIYNLKLSADLTVLSACETALGKDVKGEGLIGLTRGFMYAGSRSVVASLWKVDDRATSVLMGHFYKAMLQDGMSPAAALRLAKEKVRQEKPWRAPYFWAGFVLQGEYNQRINADPDSALSRLLAGTLVVALILISGLIIKRRSRESVPLHGGLPHGL